MREGSRKKGFRERAKQGRKTTPRQLRREQHAEVRETVHGIDEARRRDREDVGGNVAGRPRGRWDQSRGKEKKRKVVVRKRTRLVSGKQSRSGVVISRTWKNMSKTAARERREMDLSGAEA